MTTTVGDETIGIQLPLALDISSVLIRAIGAVYPDARIAYGDNTRPGTLQLQIPAHNRAGSEERLEQVRGIVAELDEYATGFVTNFDSEGFGLGLPEWFATMMAGAAREFINQFPDVSNYVTCQVHDSEGAYQVTVKKAEGKSDHALRMEAEARTKELEQQMRQIADDLANQAQVHRAPRPGPGRREEHQDLHLAYGYAARQIREALGDDTN